MNSATTRIRPIITIGISDGWRASKNGIGSPANRATRCSLKAVNTINVPAMPIARMKRKLRKDLETVGIETMGSIRKPFAPDMLDAFVDLPFEDGEFMCFAGWEDHLRRKFGDYMQLPPEEERAWRHHPIVLDFERSYEELVRK